jgi:excisionase family DNA binding protein
MIVPGPSLMLAPQDAALLAKLLRAGLSDARRDGWSFDARQRQLLTDVETLARAHRDQVQRRATEPDVTNVTTANVTAPTLVYVSTTVAATRLQIGEPAVRKLIRNGRLPGHKVHGKWVIDPDDLNDELERRAA